MIVVRRAWGVAFHLRLGIVLDDELVGRLRVGQRMSLGVSPGLHVVQVRRRATFSPQLVVEVEAGDVLELRCAAPLRVLFGNINTGDRSIFTLVQMGRHD